MALRSYKRQHIKSVEERMRFDMESLSMDLCLNSFRPTRVFFEVINLLLMGRAPTLQLTDVTARSIIPSVRYQSELPPADVSEKVHEFIGSINLAPFTQWWSHNGQLVSFSTQECHLKILDTKVNGQVRYWSTVPYELDGFKLNFVVIQLWSPSNAVHSSHFITGIQMGLTQYIVDSNGYVNKCSFENVINDPEYREFCIRVYGTVYTSSSIRLGFYFSSGFAPIETGSISGKRSLNVGLRKNLNRKPVKKQRVK